MNPVVALLQGAEHPGPGRRPQAGEGRLGVPAGRGLGHRPADRHRQPDRHPEAGRVAAGEREQLPHDPGLLGHPVDVGGGHQHVVGHPGQPGQPVAVQPLRVAHLDGHGGPGPAVPEAAAEPVDLVAGVAEQGQLEPLDRQPVQRRHRPPPGHDGPQPGPGHHRDQVAQPAKGVRGAQGQPPGKGPAAAGDGPGGALSSIQTAPIPARSHIRATSVMRPPRSRASSTTPRRTRRPGGASVGWKAAMGQIVGTTTPGDR